MRGEKGSLVKGLITCVKEVCLLFEWNGITLASQKGESKKCWYWPLGHYVGVCWGEPVMEVLPWLQN